MSDLRPRRQWPTIARVDACEVARPAHGAVLAGFYDFELYLGLVRGRRGAHKTLSYSANTSTATPIGTNQDLQLVWKSSPLVEHVCIGFVYQCSATPESASELTTLGSPIDIKVDATLYNHDTSALLDNPGCRWSFADAHLVPTLSVPGISPQPGTVVDLSGFSYRYEEAYAHPVRRLDDSAAAIGDPRALAVDTASQGANLRVRLQTTNCRILHIDVWERFEEVVSA